MYAGIYDDSLEILHFNGELFKELPPAESLSGNTLPVWTADALDAADVTGDVYPIKTCLCFSIDFINAAFSLRNDIIEAFQQHDSFRLVHTDATASSFRPGFPINTDALPDNFVVIEAFDNAFNIYYHYWQQDRQLRQYKQVPELAKKPFLDKLRSLFQVQSMRSGIQLGDQIWDEYLTRQFDYYRGGPLTLEWEDERLQLTATYQISETEWAVLLEDMQQLLEPYLDESSLDNLEIEQIILLGTYTRLLELGAFFDAYDRFGMSQIVTANEEMRVGIELVMQACLHKTRQKLQREQQEEFERKKEQLSKRDALLRDIRDVCTDPNKKEVYVKQFTEQARESGMPESVLRWMIQDHLENRIVEDLAGKKLSDEPVQPEEEETDAGIAGENQEETTEEAPDASGGHPNEEEEVAPVREEKPEEPEAPEEEKEEEEEQEEEPASPEEKKIDLESDRQQTKGKVEEAFEVDAWYEDQEFLLCKAREKGSETWRVYRIIPMREFEQLDHVNRFLELYQRESGYYQDVSEIQSESFGRFYSREYLEGALLEVYAENVGLNKKHVLNQLSSRDLKLVLALWREINGLNFAVKNLKAANFLVMPGSSWKPDAEIGVRLVGITSQTASRTEMEENVHLMLEKLLSPGVYTEMRSRFNL